MATQTLRGGTSATGATRRGPMAREGAAAEVVSEYTNESINVYAINILLISYSFQISM